MKLRSQKSQVVESLQHKSEVFGLFKVFKALVENQYGRKIKALRYDNGGEYVKSDFINYCVYVGIHMQHSIPYTPHQNGVAERKNRSLKEMATCMMEAKTLNQSTGPKLSTVQPIFRIGCLINSLMV